MRQTVREDDRLWEGNCQLKKREWKIYTRLSFSHAILMENFEVYDIENNRVGGEIFRKCYHTYNLAFNTRVSILYS